MPLSKNSKWFSAMPPTFFDTPLSTFLHTSTWRRHACAVFLKISFKMYRCSQVKTSIHQNSSTVLLKTGFHKCPKTTEPCDGRAKYTYRPFLGAFCLLVGWLFETQAPPRILSHQDCFTMSKNNRALRWLH